MPRTPKNNEYFNLIEKIGSIAHQAAEIFCSDTPSPQDKKSALIELEHEGDKVTQAVRDMLDRHQDTPLRDMQDIYHLVNNIDNIIDSLKKAASRIALYKFEYRTEFIAMGRLVLEATQNIKDVLPLLRSIRKSHKAIREFCINVAEIESRGDRQEEMSIHSLRLAPLRFKRAPDYADRKEIVQLLEHALNQCEDVSQFVDTLKKKNA